MPNTRYRKTGGVGMAPRKSQPATEQRIVLKQLRVGKTPFRKLKKLTLDFASRITLISGHNGIGKSTILGLIANTSGVTTATHRSYFDRTFQANLNEIIVIDYDNEFKEAKEKGALPSPLIDYEINRVETLTKRCALADRSTTFEARIVSRNSSPSKAFESIDGRINVGVAMKVPLPTIYLGMTRVLPLGEAQEGTVSSATRSMDEADRQLITDFMNEVILGNHSDPSSITTNRVKGTSKVSSHPKYEYDPRCVSLGQDSLGSIAMALASFQKLKREWSDYPGGLLVIDELDSGFHPNAIQRMVTKLQDVCDELQLQVVATTHSTKLIEAVHPQEKRNPADGVIYLSDTVRPTLLEAPTLENILQDMDLKPQRFAKPRKPVLKIYLEDEEALFVFKVAAPASLRRKLSKECRVSIKDIALGVGCDSLAGLSKRDPDFKSTIIVLDADQVGKRGRHGDNVIYLPGSDNKNPEQTLFAYLAEALNDPDTFEERLEAMRVNGASGDRLNAQMMNWKGDVSDRNAAKKWWTERKKYISQWQLFHLWVKDHPVEVAKFREELSTAVRVIGKRLRTLANHRETA